MSLYQHIAGGFHHVLESHLNHKSQSLHQTNKLLIRRTHNVCNHQDPKKNPSVRIHPRANTYLTSATSDCLSEHRTISGTDWSGVEKTTVVHVMFGGKRCGIVLRVRVLRLRSGVWEWNGKDRKGKNAVRRVDGYVLLVHAVVGRWG